MYIYIYTLHHILLHILHVIDHIKSCSIVFNYIVPYHIISHHIITHHIITHHIITYHIISYHIIHIVSYINIVSYNMFYLMLCYVIILCCIVIAFVLYYNMLQNLYEYMILRIYKNKSTCFICSMDFHRISYCQRRAQPATAALHWILDLRHC